MLFVYAEEREDKETHHASPMLTSLRYDKSFARYTYGRLVSTRSGGNLAMAFKRVLLGDVGYGKESIRA
jgi:hypothetical protein